MKNYIKTFESYTNESWYMPIGYEMEKEAMIRHLERERDDMDNLTKAGGDEFRKWANSTSELRKKYGKQSIYDLDASGSHDNSFIRKAYSAARNEYKNRKSRENNDPSFASSEKPTIYSDIMQAIMSYDSTMLSDIINTLENCISGDMDPEKVDIPEPCIGLTLNDAKSLVSVIERVREKKEEHQKDIESVIDDLKEMSI